MPSSSVDEDLLSKRRSSLNTKSEVVSIGEIDFLDKQRVYDWLLTDEFMNDLHTGIVHGQHDPVHVLRQRLIQNAATQVNKMERTVMCALFIKAWNARFHGKEIQRIAWVRGKEDFPAIDTDLR